MLLQSALLHLLSAFVISKIAGARLLSQHSLSLSIQTADALVLGSLYALMAVVSMVKSH